MDDLTPSQRRRQERVQQILEDGEVGLLKYLLEIEERVDEALSTAKEANAGPIEMAGQVAKNLLKDIKEIKGENGHTPTDEELLALIRPLIPEAKNGKDGHTPTDQELLTLIRPLIPEVKDGETPSDERLIKLIRPLIPTPKDGTPGKDGSPDTGEQVIEKINEDESEKKIRKEKVEDLDKLEKRIKTIETRPPAGGIVGRDLFKEIDLSSQLDGVTKTFNIQAVWRIISVDLDSYPYGSMQKTTDYTWTPTSITFGNSIDASTQLATGQKCILTVVLA